MGGYLEREMIGLRGGSKQRVVRILGRQMCEMNVLEASTMHNKSNSSSLHHPTMHREEPRNGSIMGCANFLPET